MKYLLLLIVLFFANSCARKKLNLTENNYSKDTCITTQKKVRYSKKEKLFVFTVVFIEYDSFRQQIVETKSIIKTRDTISSERSTTYVDIEKIYQHNRLIEYSKSEGRSAMGCGRSNTYFSKTYYPTGKLKEYIESNIIKIKKEEKLSAKNSMKAVNG